MNARDPAYQLVHFRLHPFLFHPFLLVMVRSYPVPGPAAGLESFGLSGKIPAVGIARLIDHTLLKPDARPAQVEQLCAEAVEWGFASVCVNSGHVPLCQRRVEGSGIRVCSVIGFPLGAMLREVKAAESVAAVNLGADELDMVMNIGWFKSGADEMVVSDIHGCSTRPRSGRSRLSSKPAC